MAIDELAAGFAVILDNLDYLLWGNYPDEALGGIALTLLMSLAAIVVSTIIGIITGIGLTILTGWKRHLLVITLGFLRAIPILMLIFWTYFLLPVLFKVDIPATFTVIMALALVGGAYIANAVYAGMIAISQEQWQAAYSLGFKRSQIIGYIILPQALKMMMPSIVNQWVSLIKDSSLAYIVSVAEFTFLATQINNSTMIYPTEIFLFVLMVYVIICWSLDFMVNRLNKSKAIKSN